MCSLVSKIHSADKCQWFDVATVLLKDQRAFSPPRSDGVLWTKLLMEDKMKPGNIAFFLAPSFLLEGILGCRVVICMTIHSPCYKKQLSGLNLHCHLDHCPRPPSCQVTYSLSLRKSCSKDVRLKLHIHFEEAKKRQQVKQGRERYEKNWLHMQHLHFLLGNCFHGRVQEEKWRGDAFGGIRLSGRDI